MRSTGIHLFLPTGKSEELFRIALSAVVPNNLGNLEHGLNPGPQGAPPSQSRSTSRGRPQKAVLLGGLKRKDFLQF